MTTRLRRFVATMACLSAFTTNAYAQTASEPADPAEGAAVAATNTEPALTPLDAAAAAQATWALRVEYHRELRRTDLSELGSGVSTLGFGIYSLTRDEPFSRGMGGAMLVGGSTHLISGIIYTLRSQRGMEEVPPASFLEGDPLARELEEMEHHNELFIAVLLGDTSVISGGITTALVGVARGKAVTQGVGLGLAAQGVLTLVLDLAHQSQGGAYLRRLRDLDMRFQVGQAELGRGAMVGVALTH